jgi:hypothetical protein
MLALLSVSFLLALAPALFSQVPTPYAENQRFSECVKETKIKSADCRATETLLERTLSEPVSYWTSWLTIFTGALAFLAIVEGFLIFQQVQLGRDEFTATHRPRLRVRNINVRHVGGLAVSSTAGRIHPPTIGSMLDGQFYISNTGGSEMRLRDAYLMFFASVFPLPMERPYEGRNGNLLVGHHWIPAGNSDLILFGQPLETQDPPVQSSFLDPSTTAIYAMGWIEYEDRRGRVRRTAFCRCYDTNLWRFVQIQDAFPDYENEE